MTGEIKWSSAPVDLDVHLDHRDAIRTLAESGRRWAHQALETDHSHGHLYVSAAGFTDEFQRHAAEADDLHLVTLQELY